MTNGIANLAGIVSPVVIGALYGVTGGFSWGMATAAGAALLGCLIYIFVVKTIEPLDSRKEPTPA